MDFLKWEDQEKVREKIIDNKGDEMPTFLFIQYVPQ